MNFKVNGVTYTGIKEKSLAWYIWLGLQTIGLIVISLGIIAIVWALASITILVLG